MKTSALLMGLFASTFARAGRGTSVARLWQQKQAQQKTEAALWAASTLPPKQQGGFEEHRSGCSIGQAPYSFFL
jgi:hypothetical protein